MDKAREASVVDYGTDTHSMVSGDLPPPAYRSLTSENLLKITRTAAMTLISMTFIIGLMVLMGVYIRSNSIESCPCLAPSETLPSPQGLRGARLNGVELEGSASNGAKSAKLPLNLEFDGDTGKLLKNNQKANVNCVVERKKATQIITSEPKFIVTPFGNMTSDPRVTHVIGEKMIFSCSSGNKKDKRDKNNRIKRETGMCSCNCAC